jgi:hypothetical protein
MECVDFESRLQDALDERGRPEADAALVEHLHGCPACRGLAQSLGLVLDAVMNLPTPPAPANLARRVLAELGRPEPEIVQLRPARRWMAVGAAAAVMAAISVSVGYWIGRRDVSARDLEPIAIRDVPTQADSPDAIAGAFWNASFGSDGRPVAASDETRWGQDVQTSLEPVTRSTAAALDSLWQAIPLSEESRS